MRIKDDQVSVMRFSYQSVNFIVITWVGQPENVITYYTDSAVLGNGNCHWRLASLFNIHFNSKRTNSETLWDIVGCQILRTCSFFCNFFLNGLWPRWQPQWPGPKFSKSTRPCWGRVASFHSTTTGKWVCLNLSDHRFNEIKFFARMYAVRRVKDAFREKKAINNTSEIQQHLLEAHRFLNIIKRQVI